MFSTQTDVTFSKLLCNSRKTYTVKYRTTIYNNPIKHILCLCKQSKMVRQAYFRLRTKTAYCMYYAQLTKF